MLPLRVLRPVAAVVAVVVVALLLWGLLRGTPEGVGTTVRSTPSVVIAVRDLARLETVQFHVERVIDLRDRQSTLFGLIKTQDAVLLVAVGEVSAGVDLGELRDGDVVADPATGTARITLPAARVLSTRLDNERTWVYARTTDFLAQRREDLETRARQDAERTLERTALDSGILERARVNAERTIGSLVRSLGYPSVVITWREDVPR